MRILVILTVLLGTRSFAAFERVNVGARNIAHAGATSPLDPDPWSVRTNPAIISPAGSWQVALSYAPHPFGLEELSRAAMAIVAPVDDFVIGFYGSRYGYDLYRETELSLAIAPRNVGNFRWGVSLTRYQLSIESYGQDVGFMMSGGIVLDLSREVSLDVSLHNIFAATIGEEREPLPRSLTLGGAFSPVSQMIFLAEVSKEFDRNVEWRFGMEYTLAGVLALRCGTNTSISSVCGGVGIAYGSVRVDYGIDAHSELGLSHTLSLGIRLEGW